MGTSARGYGPTFRLGALHGRYGPDSSRRDRRCPLSGGFDAPLSSGHGGQVAWKAISDRIRRFAESPTSSGVRAAEHSCRPGPSRPSANLAREGRFDYLHLESTGISEPLPAAAPRLGRQTALTFPLLPPPYVSSPSRGTATRSFLDDGSLFSIMLISCSGNSARGTPIGTAEAVPERRAVLRV
jgi:hypothetical protein